MSFATKIQSPTVQNQSLQSTRLQTTFGAQDDETTFSYTEPIQTRSKTKIDRLKGNTDPITEPFGEKIAKDNDCGSIFGLSGLDDDEEAVKLCREAEERQQQEQQQKTIIPWDVIGTKNSIPVLSKRQRPAFYHQDWETLSSASNNNNKDESMMDASTQFITTNTKKRKLRFHSTSYNIENDKNDKDAMEYTKSGKPLSALIHGSPPEIKTTTDQQQTNFFSPVSPVPGYMTNNEADVFMSTSDNNYNKKGKDQESLELEKQENEDSLELGRQRSFTPDDKNGNLEFNLSTGDDGENNSGVAASDKGDSSGDGSNENTTGSTCQHDQNNLLKKPVDTLSQDPTSRMEWHSDTQSTDMTMPKDSDNGLQDAIKSDEPLPNLKKEDTTLDGHVQPAGFLKRVASYIFG